MYICSNKCILPFVIILWQLNLCKRQLALYSRSLYPLQILFSVNILVIISILNRNDI